MGRVGQPQKVEVHTHVQYTVCLHVWVYVRTYVCMWCEWVVGGCEWVVGGCEWVVGGCEWVVGGCGAQADLPLMDALG